MMDEEDTGVIPSSIPSLRKAMWLASQSDDPARAHRFADQALLEFANDEEVTRLFGAMERWYE